jgi:hypothetical protein
MSELDGASPKEMEEFERRYVDTHTEIKGLSALNGMEKGRFNNSSLIKNSPGDKNIYQRGKIPGKNLIEKDCMHERQEKVTGYLIDALDIRKREILNKEDYQIKDLINAIVRLMPQKVESDVNTTHTFADEVKRLTIEKKKYTAIDADMSSEETVNE